MPVGSLNCKEGAGLQHLPSECQPCGASSVDTNFSFKTPIAAFILLGVTAMLLSVLSFFLQNGAKNTPAESWAPLLLLLLLFSF